MTTTNVTRGMTCRVGKSKAGVLWEVQSLSMSGTHAYLSKMGGDGYTNRSVSLDELSHVEPRVLEVALFEVQAQREKVRDLAEKLRDRARFFSKGVSDDLPALAAQVHEATSTYQNMARAYLAGVIEHYPAAAKKEGLI